MTKEELLNIVNTVLGNRKKEKRVELKSEDNLRSDIGFDSLDLAELTVRIEKEYNIDIFDDGFVETIGEILEKVNHEK